MGGNAAEGAAAVAVQGSEESMPQAVRRIGLLAGACLAALMLLLPPPAGLSPQGWATAALGVLMAVWWMTEAVPLAVTALLPLVLLPMLGVSGFDSVAGSYADPLIFLFLGGFMLARAMERWALHRRLAHRVLRIGGRTPAGMVGSLMAATAFVSLWISNTAAAMVMLPIGHAVVTALREKAAGAGKDAAGDLGAAAMLGIAYAATIGGMGTLIGTPPNALFAAYMRETHGVSIGFGQWMLVGIPAVLCLLPAAWLILTRLVFRLPAAMPGAGGDGMGLAQPEPMTAGEVRTGLVLLLVAAGWLSRPFLAGHFPGLVLTDAGIAIAGVVLLFALPASWKDGVFLLDWASARTIRWDVLMLFGGGLALAAAVSGSGLAQWIGGGVAVLAGMPTVLLVLVTMALIVYLGELASNTAVAAIFLPIAGAAALGLGLAPVSLVLPVALAATLGFMLPVATPPNAIVYGSGAVTARQMMRAGALLNIAGIAVVAVVGLVLGPVVLG